ncbi:MAG: DUF480 domain-containing protein [Pirellulales bacterium]
MSDLTSNPPPSEPSSKWRPLPAIDRRVLGVLIEKGKTTPDQYPMSLNALVAGCNQKSNRYPQMELDQEDVLKSLDRLRGLGVVAEVQAGGRVPRYRHFAYEWLGVNKVELAVMAELLLRGSQTEGELRGRAARMEAIADVAALRPVLESLKNKRLIISLTSLGRGHVVTHNLYEPQEMEKQRTLHTGGEEHVVASAAADANTSLGETRPRAVANESLREARPREDTSAAGTGIPAPMGRSGGVGGSTPDLQHELQSLRAEIAQLKSDLAELTTAHERTTHELQSMRDALGG